MRNDLKPCPFCGGEAKYYGDCEVVQVWCSICGATHNGWYDEPEGAANDWNRRAGWISVKEQPPIVDEGEWAAFLVPHLFSNAASRCASRYFGGNWCNKEVLRATHWMPLPTPPENEHEH